MSNKSDEKIGVREFGTMLILIIGVKLSDTTPALLFQRAKNAGWILPIIALVIVFPSYIVMLSLFKKYKDKNLIELQYHLMGKVFGLIYGMALGIIMLILMSISSRDVMDSITIMFYPKTPPVVIYLIFMGTAVFLCRRGLATIGGICWLIVPALIIAAMSAIILTVPDMRTGYIFPIGGIKPMELVKGMPFYVSLETECIMLGALFTKVRSYRDYAIGGMTALIFGSFLIAGSCFAFLLVFDVVALQHIPFPFLELTRIIRIGRFISNAEAIFFGFWIMAAALRFTIYLYAITSAFLSIFHKTDIKPYFILFAAAVIFLSLLPENFVTLVFNIRKYLIVASSCTFIPLPYILLFISKMKGEEDR